MNTLRQDIKTYLAKQDMTQSDFAADLGIDDSVMSCIINERRPAPRHVADKIHALTGISLTRLMKKDPRRKKLKPQPPVPQPIRVTR